MTFRRATAALPLAVCVAVVAHVAGFGADHAPGGGHAAVLFASLLAAIVATAGGAFWTAFGRARLRRPIATVATRGYSGVAPFGLLVAGGALAFAAIEVVEGHASVGPGTIAAILALIPAALLVALCARRVEASVVRAGIASARAPIALPRLASAYASRRPSPAIVARGLLVSLGARDRAPPASA